MKNDLKKTVFILLFAFGIIGFNSAKSIASKQIATCINFICSNSQGIIGFK